MSARFAAAVLRVDDGHGRRPGALHAGKQLLEHEVIVQVAVDRSRRRKRPPVGELPSHPSCDEATGLPLKKD